MSTEEPSPKSLGAAQKERDREITKSSVPEQESERLRRFTALKPN